MSSRRNGFVMLAASGLAFALTLAPGSAFAADECTHGSSQSLGAITGTRYTYRSGSWQYVGSQLMHVHQVLKQKLLRTSFFPSAAIATSSTTVTVYCSN